MSLKCSFTSMISIIQYPTISFIGSKVIILSHIISLSSKYNLSSTEDYTTMLLCENSLLFIQGTALNGRITWNIRFT